MRQSKTNAIAEIIAQPEDVQKGYLARELVLCTLPHRDPGDVLIWSRTNGNVTMSITPAVDHRTGKPLGLPYGSIPRLLLFWIITEAITTQSRRIVLGSSMNAFMRDVGLSPATGGGKRSDVKRLKEQMSRLLRCRISFDRTDTPQGRSSWLDMEVAPQGETWWDYDQPDQGQLLESYIILGELFYEAIRAQPVPFDLRALKALKQSPFALDLYAWATYRVFTLGKSGQNQASISLPLLQEQFGAHYNRADNFKAALTEGLASVKTVFPAFDYSLDTERLTIRSTPVPIPEATRLKKSRKLAGLKSEELSSHSEVWFRTTYPRHNLRAALKDYREWVAKRQIAVKDIDGLFRDFAAKWVDGKE
jgi:hypothetical protein